MIRLNVRFKRRFCCLCFLFFWGVLLMAQNDEVVEPLRFKKPVSRLWVNTYGKIRLTDRISWIAQTHFRFREDDHLKFAGQIGQIYNRHAINYRFSKSFNASLGGVVRINFNTDDILEDEESLVPELRIWHEYLFSVPLSGLKVCHRIRLEHRWSKGFKEGSQYIFRNRWRYMLNIKVPINHTKLEPKTFYISPEAELIMQSGKTVVNSPMEDLRLHASGGYIINSQLCVAAGIMYSMGQELKNGEVFHQKITLRTHLYFSPDFRKKR